MPKKLLHLLSLFKICLEKEIENMLPTDLISSFLMLLCLFNGNNYETVKWVSNEHGQIELAED
jgi:hypothetical protein